MIVLWCNGSTADFGSVSLGSNPSRTTESDRINGYITILLNTTDGVRIGNAIDSMEIISAIKDEKLSCNYYTLCNKTIEVIAEHTHYCNVSITN